MFSRKLVPFILPLLSFSVVHESSVVHGQEVASDQRQLIDAALPSEAPAKPKQRRLMLVFNLQVRDGAPWNGPSFPALPAQNYALEQMGKRTGAYDVVVSNDIEMFRPGKIEQFDAICFCNTVGVLFEDPELRKSLLAFVAGGKGIVGIHDALATFVQYPKYDQWPEFGRMLGGTENGGHPWDGVDMTIKIDDPDNPINAMFGGEAFTINDQAFQLQEPTFRDRLRVLVSIDPDRTVKPRRAFFATRTEDRDFPKSWIKPYGEGRVFYSGFGHNARVFWNPEVVKHFLAGIQYALGDLEADDTPSTQARPLKSGPPSRSRAPESGPP